MATDLETWIRDLEHAAATVEDRSEKVVSKGALNVKKAWRARWEGYAHIPDLPRAVTYDLDRAGDGISAEIGPDKDLKQGPLGNLIEFGSVNNAPIPGGLPALAAEEPRFVNAVADLGEKLLDER
jgi:hypothetical protein